MFPLYPIEMIVKFRDPIVSLKEMQFLVDHHLKPFKIDIYSHAVSEYRERDSQIQILDQNSGGQGMAPRSGEAGFGAGADRTP